MTDDAFTRAGLAAMAEALEAEVGPDTFFALFVDWRDGRPHSYVSDMPRPQVVTILEEWLARTRATATSGATGASAEYVPPLEAKAASLVKMMAEEEVDGVLFLITSGDIAWCSSMTGGRHVVEQWVSDQHKLS